MQKVVQFLGWPIFEVVAVDRSNKTCHLNVHTSDTTINMIYYARLIIFSYSRYHRFVVEKW